MLAHLQPRRQPVIVSLLAIVLRLDRSVASSCSALIHFQGFVDTFPLRSADKKVKWIEVKALLLMKVWQ